jgi:adenylosuccinate synthase
MPGWHASTQGITDYNALPKTAKAYIKKIEKILKVKVQLISTGQRRDELIMLKEQFT